MAQLLSHPEDGAALAELAPDDVACRMAALTCALPPRCDACAVVVEEPSLLLHADVACRVRAALRALRAAVPAVDVDAIAAAQPAAMAALLAELEECGFAFASVSPMLRAWLAGALGVR